MGVDHIGSTAGFNQQFQRLKRELRRVAKATLNNGSIGGAGLRVHDAGVIRFEEGGGIVIAGSGYITLDGDLTGIGSFSWSGPWELAGVQGKVTGDVAWSGDLNLTGNIKVLAGGKIQVGGMTITPYTGGGQIDFGNGRTIDASTGYMAIRDGSRFIVFNSSGVAINGGSGSPTVTIATDGLFISGLPTMKSSLAGRAAPGTLWLDGTNKVYKVIAD